MTARLRILFGVVVLFGSLATSASDVYPQVGARIAVPRGGKVTFEPKGPGVLLGALDPAVKKWYVPQELFYEYQWMQWEYTNYARTLYQRYVEIALEGDYFYDLYGNFISRGWLIYDWRQEQPIGFGSHVFKDRRFSSWFSSLIIASDSKGEYHYSMTFGDQIRTTLTPMTFSKPAFNGAQFDFLSDNYAATLLLSRVNDPGVLYTDEPLSNTNNTNLIGGRATARVGDFVTVGATYVNAHQSHTLSDAFEMDGNPFKGHLTTEQNIKNISSIEILLSDDSPEDLVGGATLFRHDIIITDIDGKVYRGKDILFEPIIEGGFERVGYRAADGDETIRLSYGFTSPMYSGAVAAGLAPDISKIKGVAFELVLANDYKVEIASDRQFNRDGDLVFLLVARADGNVKDNSNQKVLRFEYGLPTANEIYGFTVEVRDLLGFDFYAEFDVNRRYVQYPNVDLKKHLASSVESNAWMVNISKLAYPWFFFGEAFSMEDGYSTSSFRVDSRGAIDYEDVWKYLYEFVEDNDDHDLYADWLRYSEQTVDKAVFPGWDENGDFISDFNQNDTRIRESLVADYEEPFLRYSVDRPEYLFGMDMNNNIWVDRFENDEVADYPYKKDHRGYNAYVGVHITPDMKLTVGQLREKLIAGGKRNLTNYALFTFDKDYAGLGRLRLFEMLKRTNDNIPDNLFQWVQPPGSRGTQQRLSDPLLAQNTWVNTSWLGFDYTGIRNLNFINKMKWEIYKQRDSKEVLRARRMRSVDRFFGLINKADYTLQVGSVLVQPRWKSEYRRQTRDLVSAEERKELTETLSLILKFPIPRRTSLDVGYEYVIFNDMIEDENGFEEQIFAIQFTNLTDYQGYLITTQVGLRYTRRVFEEVEETTGMSFVTVYAGLGR